MSVFSLPAPLEDQLQKMMSSFQWGNKSDSSKGINWLNWGKLTMKKDFGLDFRHLHGFNLNAREASMEIYPKRRCYNY